MVSGYYDDDIRVVDDWMIIENSGEWSSGENDVRITDDPRKILVVVVGYHDDDARVVDDFVIRVLDDAAVRVIFGNCGRGPRR